MRALCISVCIALTFATVITCMLVSMLLPGDRLGLRLRRASPSEHSCVQALARVHEHCPSILQVYIHVYAHEACHGVQPLHERSPTLHLQALLQSF